MRPIPKKMRHELEQEARMHTCELRPYQDELGSCGGIRVVNPEWHHPWTYGGPQINEPWAILAGCSNHHDAVKKNRKVKAAFELRSLAYATPTDLEKYPRKDWTMAYLSAASELGELIRKIEKI